MLNEVTLTRELPHSQPFAQPRCGRSCRWADGHAVRGAARFAPAAPARPEGLARVRAPPGPAD